MAHRQRGALDFASADFREARKDFEKSCNGAHGEGCLFAAQMIDAPYGPIDTAAAPAAEAPKTISDAEIAERERLLSRACELSPASSCKRFGDVLIGKNAVRAEAAYHTACRSSREPDACKAQRSKEVDTLERWRIGCTRSIADDCTRLGDALYAIDAPRALRLFIGECQLRGVESIAGGVGRFVADRAMSARSSFVRSSGVSPAGASGPTVALVVSGVRVQGTVALVSVQRAFQMHGPELSACIAPFPKSTRGRVVAEAVVDLTGDVWRAKATESTLTAAATECVLSVLREFGFGPIAAPATLTLPMTIGDEAESPRRP